MMTDTELDAFMHGPYAAHIGSSVPLMFEGSVIGRVTLTQGEGGVCGLLEGALTDYLPGGMEDTTTDTTLILHGPDHDNEGAR
jgi:hypothetical protein